MQEIQELYCHNCGRYVQFSIDLSLNGNHVIVCPNCGHEHCRVVKDGIITDDRWDSRNSTVTYITNCTSSTVSTWSTYNLISISSSGFLYSLWLKTVPTN
jgi:DNA-directed RNA polymerase subunit RPC12/RpoP